MYKSKCPNDDREQGEETASCDCDMVQFLRGVRAAQRVIHAVYSSTPELGGMQFPPVTLNRLNGAIEQLIQNV